MKIKTTLVGLVLTLTLPLIAEARPNTAALQQALQSLDQAAADLYRASQNVQTARAVVVNAMQAPQEGWVCTLTYGGDHKGYGDTEQSARDSAVDACATRSPMNQCRLFRNDNNYTSCHRLAD